MGSTRAVGPCAGVRQVSFVSRIWCAWIWIPVLLMAFPSLVSSTLSPLPKGASTPSTPHLTEDPALPSAATLPKARQKTDVFAPDYIAGLSPFAENDISSRSATYRSRDSTLGAGRRQFKSNASRKKFVKKGEAWAPQAQLDGCPGDPASGPHCASPTPRTRRGPTPQRCPATCWGPSAWVCGGATAGTRPVHIQRTGIPAVLREFVKTEQMVPRADLQPLKTGTLVVIFS